MRGYRRDFITLLGGAAGGRIAGKRRAASV
jgi:hypothetical protein